MTIGVHVLLRAFCVGHLLDAGRPLKLRRLIETIDGLYAIEEPEELEAIFLVKTSTAPQRWQFTFNGGEVDSLRTTKPSLSAERRYCALVCKMDGVCCLNLPELLGLLGDPGGGQKALSVKRPPRSSYRVTGPGRVDLGRTVAANDWPNRLLREPQ